MPPPELIAALKQQQRGKARNQKLTSKADCRAQDYDTVRKKSLYLKGGSVS